MCRLINALMISIPYLILREQDIGSKKRFWCVTMKHTLFGRIKPMPSFKCKDIGPACRFEATGATVKKLNRKLESMPESAQEMRRIPLEVLTKVEKQLKNNHFNIPAFSALFTFPG